MLMRDYTDLPATHRFIHKWSEPYLPLLPGHTVLPPLCCQIADLANEDTPQMYTLCDVVCCQIADLANEDTPQMYTLCGRGPRSSLRVLRHGLEVISCVDSVIACLENLGMSGSLAAVKEQSRN